MVAPHSEVDFDELAKFAQEEGADPGDVGKLQAAVHKYP